MAGHRNKRFSIFDAMDDRGDFTSNAANAGAHSKDGELLYKGPVQYPKMVYHPMGQGRVVTPERTEPTPTGPVLVPAQVELIHKVVNNDGEYQNLRKQGWHDHPAQAIAAGGGNAPEMGLNMQVQTLEDRIKELTAQLDEAKKREVPVLKKG